jgi:hypothetical protein
MSRRIRIAIAILLLVLALPITADAQSNTEYIRIVRDSEITVSTGHPIAFYWEWLAATRGLVVTFLLSCQQDFTISKVDATDWMIHVSPQEANEYWEAIRPFTGPACRDKTPRHIVRWQYEIASLDPGDYIVETYVWLSFPITDGCIDEDGQTLTPNPSDKDLFNSTINLHVTE